MYDSIGWNKFNKIIGYLVECLKIYVYEKSNIDLYNEYCV